MIIRATEIKNKLLDIKFGRVKEGLKIGIPEIDEYIRLKLNGNTTLLIGHANVGKTSVAVYLLTVWAVLHKTKTLIWSSENTVDSIVRKIIEFKMGKPISMASEVEIQTALGWCDDYFKIIDVDELYTYKDLLAEANAIKDAWDYNLCLIDPYNSLAKEPQDIKSLGGHEYDYKVLTELRLFAKKRDISLFLNCHGNSEALRRTHPKGHEYENLPVPLGMASIEGGGKFGNRFNDCYCIHRYTGHPTEWMFTHLHVLKVKETETGGRCTPFEQPVKIRMKINNVGFEFATQDILHNKKNIKKVMF
ncbi:MAG: hypothetical protein CBE33_05190 [Candidatus Pelagibacter sp. TMED273]|nr:MAG: hypothetical protein CBE33_05190 [Candidatus Pelagibacter sp. TMED273]|tara:strand:- start:11062 stop:11976 length:915 start_codon:yes stop_codon:yes gene_type:complete